MTEALDTVTPETPDQLTDWVELESGKRARLAFIPAGKWSSILSRDQSLRKGLVLIEQRIEQGTSDDPAADSVRLGKFKEGILQAAGEVVGLWKDAQRYQEQCALTHWMPLPRKPA